MIVTHVIWRIHSGTGDVKVGDINEGQLVPFITDIKGTLNAPLSTLPVVLRAYDNSSNLVPLDSQVIQFLTEYLIWILFHKDDKENHGLFFTLGLGSMEIRNSIYSNKSLYQKQSPVGSHGPNPAKHRKRCAEQSSKIA